MDRVREVAAKEVAGHLNATGDGGAWLGVAAVAICIFDTMMDFFNYSTVYTKQAELYHAPARLSYIDFARTFDVVKP
jgi:hypothetical protein